MWSEMQKAGGVPEGQWHRHLSGAQENISDVKQGENSYTRQKPSTGCVGSYLLVRSIPSPRPFLMKLIGCWKAAGIKPPFLTHLSSVQLLSCVWLFATAWTAARQASLFITNSRSLLKLMSIESVMPSSHLILCHPLLLSPSVFPSIRVFSNDLALCMRWPKYWSFSFSISPSKEYPGLISFRMDWLDLLAVQGTLKSLLQHHSSEASILQCSAFFTVQLSHPYVTMTTHLKTLLDLSYLPISDAQQNLGAGESPIWVDSALYSASLRKVILKSGVLKEDPETELHWTSPL